MAILLVSEGTSEETNAQTIECPAPASIVQGNLIRIVAAVGNDVNLSVNETGWNTAAHIIMNAGVDGALAIFWKIAGASEPAFFTVDIDGGVSFSIVTQCSQFSGVDASAEDVTPTTLTDQNTATFDPPAITPVSAGAFVESAVYGRVSGITTPSGPSGYTRIATGQNKGSTYYMGAAHIDAGAADEEDPGVWSTFTTAADCLGITWAMRPASAGSNTDILVPTGPLR